MDIFCMFLAMCAESLPRTCRGGVQLVDPYLRSQNFCGLALLGRDLPHDPLEPSKSLRKSDVFKNNLLEGSGLDFGRPGARFWNLRGQFFEIFACFWPCMPRACQELAENLPRHTKPLSIDDRLISFVPTQLDWSLAGILCFGLRVTT